MATHHDDAAHAHRRLYDDRGDRVRHDVSEDDPSRRQAESIGGLDELVSAERDELAARDSAYADPVDHADRDEDDVEARVLKDRDDGEHEQNKWKREDHIDKP